MRKRTGSIEPKGKDGLLWVRHTIDVDGVSVRRWFPLGTASRAVARAKNRELLAKLASGEIPDATTTRELETCKAAFKRIVEAMREEGLRSWKDKQQRLRDYAEPVIGELCIDAVRVGHVRDVLDACKAAGISCTRIGTVTDLRGTVRSRMASGWEGLPRFDQDEIARLLSEDA